MFDYTRLRLVNHGWLEFMNSEASKECWRKAFRVEGFGRDEWEILMRKGCLERGKGLGEEGSEEEGEMEDVNGDVRGGEDESIEAGDDDSDNESQEESEDSDSECTSEEDATWWLLGERDHRGPVALVIPASKARIAHISTHWSQAHQLDWMICRFVWWFHSIVTFYNVPRSYGRNYTATVLVAILHPRERLNKKLDRVMLIVKVGQALKTHDKGYIADPVYEVGFPCFQPLRNEDSGEARSDWMIDCVGIPLDVSGSDVSIELKDIDCMHAKGGVVLKSFELAPSFDEPRDDGMAMIEYRRDCAQLEPVRRLPVSIQKQADI